MDTPLTNHLTKEDYEYVYEPSEDSFFLLDALEADIDYLQKLNPTICLEIGSGSGVIITAMAKKFKSSYCLATDINSKACCATKRTAANNSASIDTLNMDMTTCLKPRLVDVLIFNPPYVVTESNEIDPQIGITSEEIIHSWHGGEHGREVINKYLKCLANIISAKGVAYLLVLKENNPEGIMLYLKENGFIVIKFMERKIPGEHLYVLKINHKH